MVNIQCNLTIVCPILVTFKESFHKNMGMIYLGNQDISPVYQKRYGFVNMLDALNVLSYKRNPKIKGYNSRSLM